MSRSPRIHYPGAIYHVRNRGVERRSIFLDDEDRRQFLTLLLAAKSLFGIKIFAYCLMGNHFHLLVQVGDTPLSDAMHWLCTSYVHYFNTRHKRVGHLFQGRHWASLCESQRYLQRLVRYVHENPVRAKLVANPEEWAWSGHKAMIGVVVDPIIDLADLSRLIEATPQSDPRNAPYLPSFPGEEARPVLLDLLEETAEEFGLDPALLSEGRRGPRFTEAKLRFIERGLAFGYTGRELASALSVTPAAITLLRSRRSKSGA